MRQVVLSVGAPTDLGADCHEMSWSTHGYGLSRNVHIFGGIEWWILSHVLLERRLRMKDAVLFSRHRTKKLFRGPEDDV